MTYGSLADTTKAWHFLLAPQLSVALNNVIRYVVLKRVIIILLNDGTPIYAHQKQSNDLAMRLMVHVS